MPVPLYIDNNMITAFVRQRQILESKLRGLARDIDARESKDSITDQTRGIFAAILELRDAGEDMIPTCTPQQLETLAPRGYFTDPVDRDTSGKETEFEWACDYTTTTMYVLLNQYPSGSSVSNIAQSIEDQASWWNTLRVFPVVFPMDEPSFHVRSVVGINRNQPDLGFR